MEGAALRKDVHGPRRRTLTETDLDRPAVGIASTASDFNPCRATAPGLVSAIERGVTMAGGLTFMEDFHQAGGLPALIRRLGPELDVLTARGPS